MNYSEEEKEAIEKLEFFKETGYATFMIKYNVDRTTANGMIKRTIETVLNLIQKQEAIIDKMAEQLNKFYSLRSLDDDCFIPREYSDINDCIKKQSCKECIKEYFKKVVDENADREKH